MKTAHVCIGGPLDGFEALDVGVVLTCFRGNGSCHEYWRRDVPKRINPRPTWAQLLEEPSPDCNYKIETRYIYKGIMYGQVNLNYQGSLLFPLKHTVPNAVTSKGDLA